LIVSSILPVTAARSAGGHSAGRYSANIPGIHLLQLFELTDNAITDNA
jgi:hypothetical protein